MQARTCLMLQKSAELGCQGLFSHISTCLISTCCEEDCCGQAVLSRVRASVSSEQWPVGALSTLILEGQVSAGASVPSGSSVVFAPRAIIPLRGLCSGDS